MGEKKGRADEKPFHPLCHKDTDISLSREKTLVKSSGTEKLLDNEDLTTAGLSDTCTVFKGELGSVPDSVRCRQSCAGAPSLRQSPGALCIESWC